MDDISEWEDEDYASAFQEWSFIDWRQRAHYEVGDIVYIYCARRTLQVRIHSVVK